MVRTSRQTLHMRPLPATALATLLLLAGALPAQATVAWKDCPYTKGEEAALKNAGYVSTGPFTWGDDHDSRLIDQMLPHAKIRWIETEHFKVGCGLPEYKVPIAGKWRKKIRTELKELQKKFPKINTRTPKLDPWLRAHLFAWRLEEMYAQVQKDLGVTDKDFPQKGEASRLGRYMGKGPYLGMPTKYTVLLLSKSSDLMRYAQRAGSPIDASKPAPIRLNFVKQQSLFFGTCVELAEGALIADKSLHCHVWFNVSQTLLNGYKYYAHGLPAWCYEGLGHHYVLQIDPEEHIFTGLKGADRGKRRDPEWALKMRKRMKLKDYDPMVKLMTRMSAIELTFGDHMACWSRIDFLVKKHPEAFATFMGKMKDPVVSAGSTPSAADILKRQNDCFEKSLGMNPEAFDKAWVAFVLKRYPRR